ncbi:unnamed protein product, partial [Phaeothamnion confervicola]
HQPVGAAVAGATATIFHDAVMAPMDVIKQRLQLGYYRGIGDCARTIYQVEGIGAFYRSFPTTLFMNMPYGCVMVAMNESIKRMLRPNGDFDTTTYILAGSAAGAVAAAATTPLDVVKTRLQTQALNASVAGPLGGGGAGGGGVGLGPAVAMHSAASRCHKGGGCAVAEAPAVPLQYQGLLDAARQIRAVEGYRGFMRGAVPRLLVHTPSVAISWTTYETAKSWLQRIDR